MDIYNRERRLLSAEQLVRDSFISARDKELIFKFEMHLFTQNLKPLRVEKYLRMLRLSAEMLNKPFEEVTKDDLDMFFMNINRSDRGDWTRRDYYFFLRRLFTWMGKPHLFTPTKLPRGKSRIPNLLSKSDIDMVVRRTQHPRDKAMICGFDDGGFRVGEWFENPRIGDFIFEDNITEELIEVGNNLYEKKRIKSRVCIVNIFGKTGARTVRLNGSSAYIEDWLKMHPKKNNPKAYMWVDEKGDLLFTDYDGIRDYVLSILKKAGITKKIRLGAFRHGAMTKMDKALRETAEKTRYGTSQLTTYIHSGARI